MGVIRLLLSKSHISTWYGSLLEEYICNRESIKYIHFLKIGHVKTGEIQRKSVPGFIVYQSYDMDLSYVRSSHWGMYVWGLCMNLATSNQS